VSPTTPTPLPNKEDRGRTEYQNKNKNKIDADARVYILYGCHYPLLPSVTQFSVWVWVSSRHVYLYKSFSKIYTLNEIIIKNNEETVKETKNLKYVK
jgi:hypothetical protein